MPSDRPLAADRAAPGAAGVAPRPARRPLHSDPRVILGWLLALAALFLYWQLYLHRPGPRGGDEVARFRAVEGRVRVLPHGKDAWAEARPSDPLRVGDVVQTETRSAAEIAFDAGSVVRVRPDSVIHVGSSAESSSAAWRVQSGRVAFSIGDRATEIQTATMKATASLASTGDVDVADSGDTGFKLFGGRAEVETRRGQKISLSENEALRVDASGRAGAKLALPPAPALVAPGSNERVPFAAPPAVVTRLAWSAVPGGTSYHVGIDFNARQADLLLSAALDVPGIGETHHDLTGLEPGRYFWRVSAVSKEGLEGAFSRVSFFVVALPEPPRPSATPKPRPPLLVVERLVEVAPGVVHLQGRADPDATVTVDGATVRVGADGGFGEYVRHPRPGALVIRASSADGRSSELSRSPDRQ